MTDTPSIDLDVANGTYRFALPASSQMQIERQCRVLFGVVAARVMRGRLPLSDGNTAGLVTEAEFGAVDFDAIIREGLVAGGWASLPGRPDYVIERGDVDGWFTTKYLSQWTIEQKWTLAAAIIGTMFFGHPAAGNLPKVGGIAVQDGMRDSGDAPDAEVGG